MTQKERRTYLITTLLKEHPEYAKLEIQTDEKEQKDLLRSLFNIRTPLAISDEFLEVQNAYLQEETRLKGVTNLADLQPIKQGIYLWQGDITTLHCNTIVNAANSQMLGCFYPNHECIDNAIHTFAGIQLRLECAQLMKEQGHQEETGKAKITDAYNLPCKYVLHTVGPIIQQKLSKEDTKLLASCYRSCLEVAEQNDIRSIAFCCISTGEFHFPNDKAAKIAVQTVKEYKEQTNNEIEVIFNVFKETDYNIYRELLQEY